MSTRFIIGVRCRYFIDVLILRVLLYCVCFECLWILNVDMKDTNKTFCPFNVWPQFVSDKMFCCPQEIRNQSHECPFKIAKYPENWYRNRYRDVNPCEHDRDKDPHIHSMCEPYTCVCLLHAVP